MPRSLGVGVSCLQPGMTRLHAAVLGALPPREQGRGPFSAARSLSNEGEHPLPLPSELCLGWAWPGKPLSHWGLKQTLFLAGGGS